LIKKVLDYKGICCYEYRKPMKALITGANGFIGSHLAEKLVQMGYDVSCLARNTSNLTWLDGLNVKIVRGDFSDKDSLTDCTSNMDYVFHLAGLTKTNCSQEFYSVNTEGTRSLIETATANSPELKRFVYLSSLSAVGPKLNSDMTCEDQEPGPVSDYGKSKLRGEKAVMQYSDRLPVSVLRPSVVYGPRDRELFLMFKFARKGIMPYWGSGHTSVIYIDDMINAILLAAHNENAIGETFHISDGGFYSNDEVIDAIASSLDVRVHKVKLPRAMLPAVGYLGDGISKLMDKKSMINRDKVKELRHSEWVCNITKAKSSLGFAPQVGIKEGIKWTADWYRIHKWL
jgi:nucleoside-diphosphate-sugar epimerase